MIGTTRKRRINKTATANGVPPAVADGDGHLTHEHHAAVAIAAGNGEGHRCVGHQSASAIPEPGLSGIGHQQSIAGNGEAHPSLDHHVTDVFPVPGQCSVSQQAKDDRSGNGESRKQQAHEHQRSLDSGNGGAAGIHHGAIGQQLKRETPARIAVIRELQAQRVATVRMQLRINNQMGALVRRAMGWRLDLPEKEREALNRAADKIVKAVEAGEAVEGEHAAIAEVVKPYVIASTGSRAGFDAHRKHVEKQMVKEAEALPVYAAFVDAIRGFGALGLAIIVGEAGDVGSYRTKWCLWKRFGYATMNGKAASTWMRSGGLNAEQWIELGYNRRRRSAMFTIEDALIKNNDGKYRKLYDERKALEHERNPEMSKMQCHLRAMRRMGKELLMDLRAAWRACDGQAI